MDELESGHTADSDRRTCRCALGTERTSRNVGPPLLTHRGGRAPYHRSRSHVWHISLSIVLVLSVTPLGSCQSQNGTQVQPEDENSGSSKNDRPIDKAMEPLYIMTKGFLDLIQPAEAGFILEEAEIIEDVAAGDYDMVLRSLEDWELWVTHYLGFVICACIGILFIIVMPITGLCFCCCRCCGNCGAKGNMDEKKSDRCRRGVCGVLLAIFTLILIAGMVCGFVTNELLREQTTKDEERSILNTVKLELQSLDNYKGSTIQAFKTSVIDALQETADDVIGDINAAAVEAKDKLGQITNSVDMLDEALALAETTEQINGTLTAVKQLTGQLVTERSTLISNVSSVRADMEATLSACTGATACDDLLARVHTLAPQADFTQVDDVSDELDAVKAILDNDLSNLIRQGYVEFQDITEKVQADVQNELDDASAEVERIKDLVTEEINVVTKDLNEIHLNDTKKEIASYQDTLETYGNYRYYGGIVLCCILLLIVLFCVLGLCFGGCGESAGDEAGTCNRGVGATILMVGVAFSFLFAWLLMIIVLIIFLGGGLVYTEVCRFAVDLPNAPRPIKNTINTYVNEQLSGLDFSIELTEVLRDCEANKAIFTSLNLSQIVDLSEVLDIDNYGISDIINNIVNEVNVDLSNVVIFSNDTRRELHNLLNSGLISIDFSSYITELDKPLVSPSLTQLAAELDDVATQLDSTDPATASSLRSYATTLRNIQSDVVTQMDTHASELRVAITSLRSAINGPPNLNTKVEDLIRSLDNAQNAIQRNGSAYIRQFVREIGDQILAKLNTETVQLRHQIENDIGRCRPVATSVNNIISAGCVTVLDPFNGFWFCIAMCLIFVIPIIIVSVALVSLYRKTDEYYDDKSFDDVNYDAYNGVYPGDNIPLEDLQPRKLGRGGARSGVYNAGYLADDYPSMVPPQRDMSPRSHPPGPGYPGGPYHPTATGYPTPGTDYPSLASSTQPLTPPHYDYNSRPRMY